MSDAVVSYISVTSVAGKKLLAVLVLDNGAVPLTVLERLVDEWLAVCGRPTDRALSARGN